jgi:hypothetical protein
VQRRRIRYHGLFHGGGDENLLLEFARAVREDAGADVLTNAQHTTESHLIALAAEESRRSSTVIEMDVFRRKAEEAAGRLGNPS